MPDARAYTLVFLRLMALGCGAVAHVVEADEILRVGISPFAPFVMFTDRGPEGAAIEAQHVIARTLGVASECVHVRAARTRWRNRRPASSRWPSVASASPKSANGILILPMRASGSK